MSLKFYLQRGVEIAGTGLWIYDYTGEDKQLLLAKPIELEFEECDEFSHHPYTLRFSRYQIGDGFSMLMEELINLGVNLPESSTNQGRVDAMMGHLADLQSILRQKGLMEPRK